MSEPKLASYAEIEQFWTIDDLFDAHEILDISNEVRELEQKRLDKKG